MSQLVKYILIFAFVIFLVGLIWSFTSLRKRLIVQKGTLPPRQETVTTSTSTGTPSTPTSTPAPAPAPAEQPTPTPEKPRSVATTQQEVVYYIIEETTTTTEFGGSGAEAWAAAGVNADGSTYAEAYAN